jgi:type III secretion protein R
MQSFDPVTLLLAFGLLTVVPTLVAVTTCFLKISVVMNLVRNALGVQQVPPNIVIYGLALILTVYVMAPVGNRIYQAFNEEPAALRSVGGMVKVIRKGAEPMRGFLERHTKPEQREFFVRAAHRLWGPELAQDVTPTDFLVLMPAFIVSELTSAFQIGFLLYLPFVIIDLIVSNILLAMGMMMMSPVTVSLPLKLFLFVAVDGWTRLIEGLILTYA